MNKATHIWDFIAEEMDARGWTIWDLAARMSDKHEIGVHVGALNFLEASKDMPDVKVDLREMSHDLASAFGTSAEFWTNLHRQWCASQLSAGDQS